MDSSSALVNAIIGTEILSFIICLILLIGTNLKGHNNFKRSRWFVLLVAANMIGCLCDAVSWILDGCYQLEFILYFTTIISMIMSMIISGIFFSYLHAYITEKVMIPSSPVIVGWAAVVFGVVMVLVTTMTGVLFSFDNGSYRDGPFYSTYVVLNTSYIIMGIILITAYRKNLSFYDKVAAYTYMLVPVITVAIGLFVDGWSFSYTAITVSLLMLYIMLQSDRVKTLEEEGLSAGYSATHNGLTGLLNRSAYEDRIQILKEKNENCGVIFGDLNGLKHTNDTYGHKAGDELLIRFSNILKDLFSMDEIYHISGDEFICILENIQEEETTERVRELEKILNADAPPLACVGSAYGNSSEVDMLVNEAEAEMYSKKKVIHSWFPSIRR